MNKNLEKLNLPVDVINLLDELQSRLLEDFKSKIKLIIIHGSIATGDFNFNKSDIDYLVALEEDFSEEEVTRLEIIHKKLMGRYIYWGGKLEGSYLLEKELNQKDPPENKRLYFNDGLLRYEKYGGEWTFEKLIIMNFGIVIFGEYSYDQADMISYNEIINATRILLSSEWKPKIENRDFHWTDEYLVFGVLTMCRIICCIDTGLIKSKSKSAQYVLTNYGQNDSKIINAAVNWNYNEAFLYKEESKNFISKVINKYI